MNDSPIQLINLPDDTKHIVDTVMGGTTLAAFFNILPSIVTGLTGLWILIRIYETDTVQSLLRWLFRVIRRE